MKSSAKNVKLASVDDLFSTEESRADVEHEKVVEISLTEFDTFEKSYTLALRGQMTHRAALGTDPRGNLTRIDNALAQMPERLGSVQAQLENLYQQQSAAQAEVGKLFPQEEELRVKTARLTELDSQLNMDGRRSQPEQAIAKSSRPSVLESLKRPMPPRTMEKKSKPHEEVL